MNNINIQTNHGLVSGFCDPAFQPVVDTFVANLQSGNELGASCSLRIDNQVKVHLWGGFKDKQQTQPWQQDTLSLVFSCTKAMVALCALRLIDQGKLKLDEPVATYWPEFAQAGKENATVRMMLNHSVGLPALRELVKPDAYLDFDYMAQRLAAEEPFWPVGSQMGYHLMTYGWTVGELVRRASGLSLGEYFKQEIANPLDAEFYIGAPASTFDRIAKMTQPKAVPGAPVTDFVKALFSEPASATSLSWLNNGKHRSDSPEAYAAEIGGGGGISNAEALAKLYAPLANGGIVDDYRVVDTATLDKARQVSMATGVDNTLRMPTRFGLGFMRTMDNRHREMGHVESFIAGEQAFGHVGAGGHIGFADPAENLSFGYTMNRMGAGLMLNERGQSLIDATYQVLGYHNSDAGFWVK